MHHSNPVKNISGYVMSMADTSLSKPTLVFGLSLWVIAGIGVGAAAVLLLFLFSLWLLSKRKPLSPTPPAATATHPPEKLAASVQSKEPTSVQVQVEPFPFSDPGKVEGIERQALLVDQPDLFVQNRAAPEVSHLGWGQWYTLRDLENATNGFAHGNVIGEGGYGIVYYGVLDDNTHIAIKNLFNNRGQAEKEFKVEVEAIGRVRHKSLVRLVGYCAEGAQRMLVYEYVNNGNLEQWLHGDVGPCSPLTWEIRMNIILDTAKGLSYLHEGLEPKVVHRDIKSSNILLDKQWNSKVSDFGLAKLLGSDDSYIATRVMGTFGYVAPEYATTGMLTERSDIYSFGVLVMELISGRDPVDYSKPPGEVNLVDWFKTMVANKNPEGVIDPKIQDKPTTRALKRALLVALRCVDPNALKRPKMGQVVHMLELEEPSFRHDHKPTKSIQGVNQVKIDEPSPV